MIWIRTETGWTHRPLWKRLVNGALRRLQPRHPRPVVVYTRTVGGHGIAPPRVVGYGIGRIRHTDRPDR